MSRTLAVHPHLTIEELKARYLRCKVVGERDRLHCVLMKAECRPAREIAAFFHKKEDWVRRTVRKYNKEGPEGMKDGRVNNGKSRLLDDADHALLEAALLKEPEDGGNWSGPKVAEWIRRHKGVEATNHVGWVYLKRLGYSIQRPRPKHPDADQEAQATFKKGGLKKKYRAFLEPIPTR